MKKMTPEEWLNRWVQASCEGPDDHIIVQEFLDRLYKIAENDVQLIHMIHYYQNRDHTATID